MAEKKQYRNAIRSRMLIRSAFEDLLREKPFEKITATDIINRSGLNRSTFYAHYPDVKGIVDETINEVVEAFRKSLTEMDFSAYFDDPTPILCGVLDHLRQNQELYRLLVKADLALSYIEQIKAILIQVVLDIPDLPKRDDDDVIVKIRVRMLLGGVVDIFHHWLSGEIPCSLERLLEDVTSLIVTWGRSLE